MTWKEGVMFGLMCASLVALGFVMAIKLDHGQHSPVNCEGGRP